MKNNNYYSVRHSIFIYFQNRLAKNMIFCCGGRDFIHSIGIFSNLVVNSDINSSSNATVRKRKLEANIDSFPNMFPTEILHLLEVIKIVFEVIPEKFLRFLRKSYSWENALFEMFLHMRLACVFRSYSCLSATETTISIWMDMDPYCWEKDDKGCFSVYHFFSLFVFQLSQMC